jgi:L-iditol 2-dehydrogenase
MKALVLTAYKNFEYQDFPLPVPGEDEVLIRVRACGICGSDIHGMDGSSGRRIPPIIMGHEAAGVIEALGKDVKDWQVGERVTFDSTIYCGKCIFCLKGMQNLCENRKVLGVSTPDFRQHGAFADYVVVPARVLYRLPDEVSFERAAMVEAISIAFHGVGRTPVQINSSAVVMGTGMIGLLVVQALRLAGCGQIIAVDIDANKLKKAVEYGADLGLRSDETDVVSEIKRLTGGLGADLAYEVVGIPPTFKLAVQSVRKGGSVGLIGNLAHAVEMPLQAVVTRQVTLYGSCASSGEYPACLDMLARGKIQVDDMISEVAPLRDGKQWFDRLYAKEPGLMKVILVPEG